MRALQRMENPRHYGPITCICLDRKRTWVICGTSTGVLSLWDIRFGILIKSWRVGVALKGRFGRVHQCVVHPTKGKGRWVVVAVETHKAAPDSSSHTLLEIWDIERSTLVETFSTRAVASSSTAAADEPQESSAGDAESSPAAAIAALVRARQESNPYEPAPRRVGLAGQDVLQTDAPVPPSPDVHAVVTGADFGGLATVHRSHVADSESKSSGRSSGKGFIITGSEDCKLRYWDLGRPERSVILSGIENEYDKPTYRCVTRIGVSSHLSSTNHRLL